MAIAKNCLFVFCNKLLNNMYKIKTQYALKLIIKFSKQANLKNIWTTTITHVGKLNETLTVKVPQYYL